MDNIFLTIIIPAYNEEANIKNTLIEIAEYLKNKGLSYEMIVVDDGSADKTAKIAQDASGMFTDFRLLKNEKNKGKGSAVRKGMFAARGECALFMDADNSTSIYELDKFLPYFKEGYDIVIASRRLKDSMVEESQPFLRAKMGQFYILLTKIMLGLDLSDFNCGFKAYNTRSAMPIFKLQKMDDWSFDVELLFLANKYRLKIKEAPVRWVHKSGSKVKPFKDAIKSFASVLKIKLNDIRHRYQ